MSSLKDQSEHPDEELGHHQKAETQSLELVGLTPKSDLETDMSPAEWVSGSGHP